MPAHYSIKDLERVSGIKAHTLRIWEQRYGILRPGRTSTNIRYYSDADLKRVLNISLLNQNGHKISDIAKLSDEVLFKAAEQLLGTYHNQNQQVKNLLLCLMDLDEAHFEKAMNTDIAELGFEAAFEKVVFPFLRHLGDLWQVSVVSVAQEHYISNLIRKKLISGLDQLKPAKHQKPRTFLFFLPGSELHELGLLYACYLAKARGHHCVYLGQRMPLEDLVEISKRVKPDCLVALFTTTIPEQEASAFLSACSKYIPNTPFLVSGRLFFIAPDKPRLPGSYFQLFENFADFREML